MRFVVRRISNGKAIREEWRGFSTRNVHYLKEKSKGEKSKNLKKGSNHNGLGGRKPDAAHRENTVKETRKGKEIMSPLASILYGLGCRKQGVRKRPDCKIKPTRKKEGEKGSAEGRKFFIELFSTSVVFQGGSSEKVKGGGNCLADKWVNFERSEKPQPCIEAVSAPTFAG